MTTINQNGASERSFIFIISSADILRQLITSLEHNGKQIFHILCQVHQLEFILSYNVNVRYHSLHIIFSYFKIRAAIKAFWIKGLTQSHYVCNEYLAGIVLHFYIYTFVLLIRSLFYNISTIKFFSEIKSEAKTSTRDEKGGKKVKVNPVDKWKE